MANKAIFDFSSQLMNRWQTGDIEGNYEKGLFNCPTIPNGLSIDSKYFECNSLYLECYLQKLVGTKDKNLFKIGPNGLDVKFKEIYINKMLSRKYVRPTSKGVVVSIEVADIRYDFELENTCTNTYLPQRKYSSGLANSGEEFEWDNFDRNFYIDKYLVPHYKTLEWAQLTKNKIGKTEKKKWHLPSVKLSKNQMKNYCYFNRSKLLSANLYDAASFIPFNEKSDNPTIIKKAPFPWSRKKNIFDSFDNTYDEGEFSEKNCNYLYTKECLEKGVDYNPYEDGSVTWMGIFNPLGGVMEYLTNFYDSKQNLRLSSYYFPLYYKFHQISMKGNWKNELQDVKNLSIDGSKITISDYISKLEVGFRCFKQRP